MVRAQQTVDPPRRRSKVILKERGLGDHIHDPKRWCPKFRCGGSDRMDCRIRRTLYSQPGFRGVTSLLEKHEVSRRCSSPSSTRSLILSSNAGGVRSGVIVNSLLRQGRKTSEEVPSSHWMKFQFTSYAGKIFLVPTNLAHSLISVFRTSQSS